jgi:predicted CXXCH cytochrome family protein
MRMTNATSVCIECHQLANTATPAAHLAITNPAVLWPGGQYGTLFPARSNATDRGSCMNCHAPHGWPVATNTAMHYSKLLMDSEENLCYTCHDTNGPALKNVKNDFAKARRHPIGDADTLRRLGRSVECSDCHNTHQAVSGSHTYTNTATAGRNMVSNPLRGVAGVAINYTSLTNFQTVTTNLYSVIPKSVGATNEYQICFRCHTSYSFGTSPPPGLTPVYSAGTAAFTNGIATIKGTGTAWNSTMVGMWMVRTNDPANVYKVTAVANATNMTITPVYAGATASGQGYALTLCTDVAMEFSPRNKSGHPVVTGLDNYPNSLIVGGKRGLLAAALLAPWNVNVGQQTMMCSDCHNTDGVSTAAQGPHGSAAQFMLRGNNANNWPNVTLSNFATSWCANCHVKNSAGRPHTEGDHSGAQCYVCHITIPHGGKMSRLIADRDGTMPARYAYNNNLSNVGMQLFTKAASGSYTENSNCRTSCGHHGSGTGNENW